MSRRTAMAAWKIFLEDVPNVSDDYQLDDVVLTGRVAFANAANASPELISEHAGIGTKAAARYSEPYGVAAGIGAGCHDAVESEGEAEGLGP